MSTPSSSPPPFSTALSGAAQICALAMLLHSVLSGTRIAVMLAGLKLGLSTLEVGILVAVFALLPMMFSVQAGRLIDIKGPWRPMCVSAGLVLVGAVIPFVWLDIISLILCAILVGLGHMVYQVAALSQLGRGNNEQRRAHLLQQPATHGRPTTASCSHAGAARAPASSRVAAVAAAQRRRAGQ